VPTVKLRHAIKIAASCESTFRALTEFDEMAAWHAGRISGSIAPGAVLRLHPKPGLAFGWRTEATPSNTSLVQTCVEGPGNSVGKSLRFELSDIGGCTVVTLTDGEWAADDPHLPFCNTHWGNVLHRLKAHVEKNLTREQHGHGQQTSLKHPGYETR
jgi:uncharacterized protein YndB with AHSA1/START domain